MKKIILVLSLVFLISCVNKKQETEKIKEITKKEVVTLDKKALEETPEIDSKGSFEGRITYQFILQTKGNPRDFEPMKKLFGDTIITTHSKGRYSMNYPGGLLQYIKYMRDNYQYRKMDRMDTLFITNAWVENSTLYSILEEETSRVELGRKLKMISIVTNQYKKYYYYDSTIYMNPEYFKRHKLGYENKYYEKAKSPYLYAEIEYDKIKVIMKAIKIEEMKIPESFFELPDVTTKFDEVMGK